MRTFLAVPLILLAAALACLAIAGSYLERLAETPEQARAVAGPLSGDPAFLEALAPRLAAVITDRLPDEVAIPDALEPVIEQAAVQALDTIVTDPGFEAAWLKTIDLTREDYVAQLRAVHAGEAENAGVGLDIGPVAALGYAKLTESAGSIGLGGMVEGLRPEASVVFDLGVPPDGHPIQGPLAAAVAQAGLWIWGAAGSGVATLLALAVAGRGRWMVLALGGAVLAVAGFAARVAAGDLATGAAAPGGSGATLEAIVTDTLVSGLEGQLVPVATGTLAGGAAVMVVSLVAHALSRRR